MTLLPRGHWTMFKAFLIVQLGDGVLLASSSSCELSYNIQHSPHNKELAGPGCQHHQGEKPHLSLNEQIICALLLLLLSVKQMGRYIPLFSSLLLLFWMPPFQPCCGFVRNDLRCSCCIL